VSDDEVKVHKRSTFNLNQLTIMGHVGAPPVLDFSRDGLPMLKFGVSSDERDFNGKVEFHPVIVFGERAEKLYEIIKSGSLVFCQGPLNYNSWIDRKKRRQSPRLIPTIIKVLRDGRGGKRGEE